MSKVSVRYIVDNVDEAIAFYTNLLDFRLYIEDLTAKVVALRSAGAVFRNDIVAGNGGKQILLEDPAGNCIELFEAPSR